MTMRNFFFFQNMEKIKQSLDKKNEQYDSKKTLPSNKTSLYYFDQKGT